MIHHGGSGITRLVLKHGCVSLVVPHTIDQFVWDRIITHLRAGPKGIKIGEISTKKLEPKILDLVNRDDYKTKAEQLALQMSTEDFREGIYRIITGEYRTYGIWFYHPLAA